jgi:hypothetical protein
MEVPKLRHQYREHVKARGGAREPMQKVLRERGIVLAGSPRDGVTVCPFCLKKYNVQTSPKRIIARNRRIGRKTPRRAPVQVPVALPSQVPGIVAPVVGAPIDMPQQLTPGTPQLQVFPPQQVSPPAQMTMPMPMPMPMPFGGAY